MNFSALVGLVLLYHPEIQTSNYSFTRRTNDRNVSFKTLCGGQFTLPTQLTNPSTQHHSFFRNLPPLFRSRKTFLLATRLLANIAQESTDLSTTILLVIKSGYSLFTCSIWWPWFSFTLISFEKGFFGGCTPSELFSDCVGVVYL